MALIEVICNDRLGQKGERLFDSASSGDLADRPLLRRPVRVKCEYVAFVPFVVHPRHADSSRSSPSYSSDDTVGDLKKLVAAQTGTKPYAFFPLLLLFQDARES